MKTFDNEWERVHRSKSWGRYPAEEVVRFVARNYFSSDRKNVRILDLGCGGGANSWFLNREGFKSISFDGSLTAAQKCRDFLAAENLPAMVFQADAASLPLPNETIDCIIDGAAISANSLENISKILCEAYRILKPGGKIFSTGLFKRSMTGYGSGHKIEENTFRNITNGAVANIGTVHFFDENEIKELYRSAGFDQIEIESLERTDNRQKTLVAYFIASAQKNQ